MQRLRLSRKCTVFLYSSKHVSGLPVTTYSSPTPQAGSVATPDLPLRVEQVVPEHPSGAVFKPSTQSQVAVQVVDLAPSHHLGETSAPGRTLSAFTIPIRSHTVMNDLPVSTNSKFREVSVTQSALPWDTNAVPAASSEGSRVRDHQRMSPGQELRHKCGEPMMIVLPRRSLVVDRVRYDILCQPP